MNWKILNTYLKRKKSDSSKQTKIKSTLKVTIEQLVEGNRNNTLFKFAINYCLNNPEKDDDELIAYLLNTNTYAEKPLDSKEVKEIANSVYKMHVKGTLSFPELERDIQRGIMKFKRMTNLSFKEYKKETKRRQSCAAKRTNSLISKSKQKKD